MMRAQLALSRLRFSVGERGTVRVDEVSLPTILGSFFSKAVGGQVLGKLRDTEEDGDA